MMKLYRAARAERAAVRGLVQIGGIAPAPETSNEQEEVGSFGD